ncbi:MAG: hypothetical protein C4346_04425 [Chloroflexota bacterium]
MSLEISQPTRLDAYAHFTHVECTCPPLPPRLERRGSVRLACVKHAASVHPEPGSSSPSRF